VLKALPTSVVLLIGKCAMVVIVASLLGGMVAFSALVKRQYRTHRAAWEADGRPLGYFFWNPGLGFVRTWKSEWVRQRLSGT
jgi:hypothetical protein